MIRSDAVRVLAAAAVLPTAAAACGDLMGGAPELDLVATTLAEAGASNPTVALDTVGLPLVAWVGGTDTMNVYLARPGDTAPVRVNDIAGDAAPHAQAPAQIAVGPNGNVYVLWQNNTHIEGRRFPASDLRFARSVDGGRTFAPAVYVNDDAGGEPASHTFHDLAIGAAGEVYVSWIDGRTRAGAGAGPQIRIARSSDGGLSFGPSVVVAENACPCCRTSLALGADGAVYLAWRQVFPGSVRDIVVARSDDGGATWNAPVRVREDGWVFDGCPHAGPALAVDTAGAVHVAWYTGAEGAAGVYHARSDDGGRSWGGATRLSGAGFVPTSQVALAPDRDGGVWVAWEGATDDEARIRLARAGAGEAPVALEMGAHAGALPSLAAGQSAFAMAWLDGEAVRLLTGHRQAEH